MSFMSQVSASQAFLNTAHNLRRHAGFAAAFAVMFIWSGWIVVSRSGVQGDLSIWDLSLLRFGTATIVVVPLLIWRKQSIAALLKLDLVLPALASGLLYVLFSFAALRHSPAANAGVVVNGLMPVGTLLMLFLLAGKRPTLSDGFIGAILLGANLLLLQGDALGLVDFLLFIAATLSITFYMVFVREKQLDPALFFFAVPVVNFAAVVPLWVLFDGAITGPIEPVVLQAGYQGVVVSIFAITLLTYAVRHVGSVMASVIMAGVPVTTALLSLVVLGEAVSAIQIFSLTLATFGICLHFVLSKRSQKG